LGNAQVCGKVVFGGIQQGAVGRVNVLLIVCEEGVLSAKLHNKFLVVL
jgi:hypothetical protein